MAQQVGKRYRLLKNAPNAKKDTIVTYDHEYGMYSYIGILGQLPDPMFYKEEVENNPDWFEEVKDAPKFKVDAVVVSSQPSQYDGAKLTQYHTSIFHNNAISQKQIPEIKKAIEDIVNGVDEKDKCLFDADKINARLRELELDQLQREAFEAARYTITGYPCAEGMQPIVGGFWYKTYEDYKNSKK